MAFCEACFSSCVSSSCFGSLLCALLLSHPRCPEFYHQKGYHDQDAGPITIFSVLYRAGIRSREVLRYMATYMPQSIATATARVPAESAAALVAVLAEHAINQGTTLAGLGIDLQRCFNTLAPYPLRKAMARLGIPGSYVCGWARMLQDMTRTISIGLAHSRPMASTTEVLAECLLWQWQSLVGGRPLSPCMTTVMLDRSLTQTTGT